jgi:hypothetical protein
VAGYFDLIDVNIQCKENVTDMFTRLLTYLLTTCSRFHPEKLRVPQLVRKFPTFYRTRRFITAFTRDRHLFLYWARSIQPILPHPTSRRTILILFCHLQIGLPSGLLPSGFPTKILYARHLYPPPPKIVSAQPISVFLTSSPEWYLVRSTEHKAPRYVVFSTPQVTT